MPVSTKTRHWRKAAYEERRLRIIRHLGERCAKCGSTERLEFDHIDPAQKSFEISAACWWMSWDRLLPEINKCQLLCKRCHTDKTIIDTGKQAAKGNHGTYSSSRYCRCELCRAARNAYMIEYKHRTGRRKKYVPRTGLVHGTENAYGYYKCRCDICKAGKHQRYLERKQRLQNATVV